MNIRQWRQEFENMKNFYELKLREKNQLLQRQKGKKCMNIQKMQFEN